MEDPSQGFNKVFERLENQFFRAAKILYLKIIGRRNFSNNSIVKISPFRCYYVFTNIPWILFFLYRVTAYWFRNYKNNRNSSKIILIQTKKTNYCLWKNSWSNFCSLRKFIYCIAAAGLKLVPVGQSRRIVFLKDELPPKKTDSLWSSKYQMPLPKSDTSNFQKKLCADGS